MARQSETLAVRPSVMPSLWLTLTRLILIFVVVLSLVIVWRLDTQNRVRMLRTRFIGGIPWGTVLVVLGLLFVYLFIQGGFLNWNQPVVLPFRAWSYLYPLGMVLAPFSHAGPNHLTGNLIGTLALAPLAEYAWSHYPTEHDSQANAVLPTNPVGRVLAVPLVTIVAGLFTSFFSLGPVIGFSGVVFAFAGFALVRYPLSTVVAFSASSVLSVVYTAIRNPVTVASAEPSFGLPWWATIAIQTHAIGLLFGVLVGVALFRRREGHPSAGRIWLGTLIFVVAQSFWAVYWFRGHGSFVLFRALGTVLVFALALLVAASIAAPGRFSITRPLVGGTERRATAAVVILLALAALSAPAIPVNLTTVDTPDRAAIAADGIDNPSGTLSALTVREYTVTYAENVTNQKVAVFDISAFGETTEVNTSGVIVTNEHRQIWVPAVRESKLAFAGCATVRLGGIGWTERVTVSRTGWKTIGGEHAYVIRFSRGEEKKRIAYLSEPATAEPTIRGKNVSIMPSRKGFRLVVSWANRTLGRAPLPKNGTTTHAANLTFSRNGKKLFVSVGETRVRIAKTEKYH
ncbi:MAG TPA: rhomboid family intramembrane serine protease [Halococcus sp.]|nr:rhomboid family intramembrane serine protease [Halococcus sp.]